METVGIRQLVAADLPDATRLLCALNPDMLPEVVAERLHTVLADHPHYQLVGAFSGGKLLGLSGAWIATKIWCGRYLEIDNIVIDEASRSLGIGSLLVNYLEEIARERDCKVVVLDSYASNCPSHRFYYRQGFEIWGFHFVKAIGDWKGKDPA